MAAERCLQLGDNQSATRALLVLEHHDEPDAETLDRELERPENRVMDVAGGAGDEEIAEAVDRLAI